MKYFFLFLLILTMVSCSSSPSQGVIQTALAQTLTAQPKNTNTPTFTETVLPTFTYTPLPTNTQKPTNTPRPTATNIPQPEPISFEGQGDSVVDVQKWQGPAIVQIISSGGGHFAVWNYGNDGKEIDLLVNTISPYVGTRPLDFMDGEQTTRFSIEGRGEWKIQILPLEDIRRANIPGIIEGNGDDVIFLNGNGTPDLLKVDASKANGHFSIWGYGNDVDLLVNDIAPYSGTVVVPSSLLTSNGGLILSVSAEGSWSIGVTVPLLSIGYDRYRVYSSQI